MKYKPIELSDDDKEGDKLAESSRKAFLQMVHRELMDEKKGKSKRTKSKPKPKKEKKPKKKKAGNSSRASNQPSEKLIQPPIPEEPKPAPVLEKPTIINENKSSVEPTSKPVPMVIRPKLINPAENSSTQTPRKPILINPSKPTVVIRPPVDRVLQQPGKKITIPSNPQIIRPGDNNASSQPRQSGVSRPVIIKKTQ